MTVEFSHQELSLLLFLLEGGPPAEATSAESPSCEEACPIVEDFEHLTGINALAPEKQLVRHLNNHLREGLIESGIFELMANAQQNGQQASSSEEQARFEQANERLRDWSCEIKLDQPERQMLTRALSRLPRSAWITMPRALWRLKKKLRMKDEG